MIGELLRDDHYQEARSFASATVSLTSSVRGGYTFCRLSRFCRSRGAARVARKAQAAQFAANVLPIIRDIQAAGFTSLNPIAGHLNARKVATG
jgi:hypothetical protein